MIDNHIPNNFFCISVPSDATVRSWTKVQFKVQKLFEPDLKLLEFSGAIGREGKFLRLSHYHGTSGLAQTRKESVDTTVVLILNPCTATPNTFPTARRSHRLSKSPTEIRFCNVILPESLPNQTGPRFKVRKFAWTRPNQTAASLSVPFRAKIKNLLPRTSFYFHSEPFISILLNEKVVVEGCKRRYHFECEYTQNGRCCPCP